MPQAVRLWHCWPGGQAPFSRNSQVPFGLQASHRPVQASLQQMDPPPARGLHRPEVHWEPVVQVKPRPTRGSVQLPPPSQTPATPGATASQGVPAVAKRGAHSLAALRQAPNAAHRFVVTSAGKVTHTVLLVGQSTGMQFGSLPGLTLQSPSAEHAWQTPLHALSQQRPETQLLLAQSVATVQALPSGRGAATQLPFAAQR